MKRRFFATRRKRKQSGYALLLAVFFVTLLMLSTIVAAPSIRTARQREKEEEMIWRGKQYVRGIKLYYRKTGHFPTSLDDLTKPKMGSLRFMRQAYKDPMNRDDGTWRLIYVGPAGQLIGSLKPPQTLQIQQGGTPAGALGGTPPGSTFGQNPGSTPPAGTPQASAGNPQGAASTTNDPGAASTNGPSTGTPSSFFSSDSSIIGGNIVGVGSKVTKNSVIIYDKAHNYHLFEFIWDPSKDAMTIGGQPGGTQVGTPIQPGQTPGAFGLQPTPSQPASNPPPGTPSAPSTPPLSPDAPPPQP